MVCAVWLFDAGAGVCLGTSHFFDSFLRFSLHFEKKTSLDLERGLSFGGWRQSTSHCFLEYNEKEEKNTVRNAIDFDYDIFRSKMNLVSWENCRPNIWMWSTG